MSELFASEISIDFETPLWEMNCAGQLLLLTTKDADSLQTEFSLYDIGEQKFLFESIAFDEPWWISVFLFNGNQILFQTYDDTQDIEKRTVFCFDVKKQEVTWAVEDVKIQQLNNQTIMCSPIENDGKSFMIDVETGAEVVNETPSTELGMGTFPVAYSEESEFYATLKKFIEARTDQEVVGTVDYLEYEGLILVSANFKQSDTYSLELFVYDAEGVLQDQATLEKNLDGLAIGTFFMVGRALIFVEEKRKLKICSIA